MTPWRLGPDCLLWRCPECSFIRRDLALASAGARGVAYGGDPSADRVRLELTYRRLRHRVPRPRRVLEIGCGGGQLTRRLAQTAEHVIGVDTEPPRGVDDDKVTFVVGRIEDVPLPAEEFDLILGIHVLEHVADLDATLRRIRSLLAPHGTAYFITPDADCTALRHFRAAWWMLEDPTHVRFLSRSSVVVLARRAGFSSVKISAPLMDSLMCDGATIARALQREPLPEGVLSRLSTKVLALATLPASLAVRAAVPSWRPAMEIVLTSGRTTDRSASTSLLS